MATVRWQPRAAKVAQVDTLTVGGTVEAGDKFLVTINGKTLSVSASSTSTSTTASEIATAWNALSSTTYPEFAEITAAANSSDITLTADTAGKPFTVSVSTTESNGGAADTQTFTKTSTTSSAGPNHWDSAANWSGGAVPTTGDDVYIENSDVDILYGLAQSAETLASLTVAASFTGNIGLPETNEDSTSYHEYRDAYLAISATTCEIGSGPGLGSGRIKLNTGSNACTLTVRGTGTALETDVESLLWKGAHASNVVNVFRGSVALAGYAGETATVATLRVGYIESEFGDAVVRCGSGVSLTTVNQSGGSLVIASSATTVTKTGGELTVRGTAAITTLTNDSGPVYYESSGTITTLSVGSDASIDFGRDMRARTVTNAAQLYSGATVLDPFATVTWSGGLRCNRCAVREVTLDLGQNRLLTPS